MIISSGCRTTDTVHSIIEPGATLEIGGSYTVTSEMYADYEVYGVEVRLKDDDTKWEHTWTFEGASWSSEFTFTRAIEIPADTPSGYHQPSLT